MKSFLGRDCRSGITKFECYSGRNSVESIIEIDTLEELREIDGSYGIAE